MSKPKGKARAKANKKKKNQGKNSYFLRKKRLIAKIRKWDDPILKETCSPVDGSPANEGEDSTSIIKEMKSILLASDNGLGIAASQIGYAKRIFVTRPTVTSHNITAFINATIISESKEREKRGEGCLSYPGIIAVIDRPAEITVEYEDEQFKVCSKEFKGLDACVVCHEHDHTVGVCLVGEEWKREQEQKPSQEMIDKAKSLSLDDDSKYVEVEEFLAEVEKDEVIPEDVESKS